MTATALQVLRTGQCSASCLLGTETGRCSCRCGGSHHGSLTAILEHQAEAERTPGTRRTPQEPQGPGECLPVFAERQGATERSENARVPLNVTVTPGTQGTSARHQGAARHDRAR